MPVRLSIITVLLLMATTLADPELFKEETLVRRKRFFCGFYPSYSFSYYWCSPYFMNLNWCSHNHCPSVIYIKPIVISPTQQCIGPCVNGLCPSGYTCNASNMCCKST